MLKLNAFKAIRGYVDCRRKFEFEDLPALVLVHLMHAGKAGYTPADLKAAYPGFWMPHLSQFVCQFRKVGVVIDTIRTNELGSRGLRLRYVLRSEITITEVELTEEVRYAA